MYSRALIGASATWALGPVLSQPCARMARTRPARLSVVCSVTELASRMNMTWQWKSAACSKIPWRT